MPTPPDQSSEGAVVDRRQWLSVLALLSMAAGFLHAAVISAHEGDGRASAAFTAVAVFQVAWGALVLARPAKLVLIVGAVVNAAIVVGWVMSRTTGISFIDGFQDKDSIAFTDGVVTGVELLLVAGIVATLAVAPARRVWPSGRLGNAALASAGLVVALVGVPAVAQGADHGGGASHREPAGASAHGKAAGASNHAAKAKVKATETAAHDDEHSASTPVPYDPTMPIDLGWVEGVTPQQQAAAENAVAGTVTRLPQWADPAVAEAAGFRSIGDGFTGIEHFVNTEFMENDVILDPDQPESLVYNTEGGGRRLVAAMYMVKKGTPLADVPDVGGALMQWHTHENLCYTADGKVRGITNAKGECPAGLFKPVPTPMIHVWIEPHPCGPFAALEGIGGGTIAEGEERLCDDAHGS